MVNSNLWLPYTQMQTALPPLEVVATKGSEITLADGSVLIDGIASWWTACHGYNHPHIVAAMQQQLATVPHIMLGGLVHEQTQQLAQRLAKLLPADLDHVFFNDSGSVAVEVALKMALQFWQNQGSNAKTKILSFINAYHGDTCGAMSVCDPDEGMHKLFAPMIPQQVITQLPSTDAQWQQLSTIIEQQQQQLAAIIIEPLIQGAGGMQLHPPETLTRLKQLCADYELLLIFDEVFTGFGRTGSMFAMDQAQVVPDIVCLSKALTGGHIGLAATVATDKIYDSFLSDSNANCFMHGPTFMGNPLACAAANASLDLFEQEDRLAQVKQIEAKLHAGLDHLQQQENVAAVRIKGAMAAVELRDIDIPKLKAAALARKLWLRPFGNILYTTPALNISSEHLDMLIAGICELVQIG